MMTSRRKTKRIHTKFYARQILGILVLETSKENENPGHLGSVKLPSVVNSIIEADLAIIAVAIILEVLTAVKNTNVACVLDVIPFSIPGCALIVVATRVWYSAIH
jgi:hypothetical protein